MCTPGIGSIGGKGSGECPMSRPASVKPFKAAYNFEPLVDDFKPMSNMASLLPFPIARRAASSPVKYADGKFPVAPFQPCCDNSLEDAAARTISPVAVASVICTYT